MQFQVPQFIDIEDKIFGPLTLRQFLYLVGAGGFSFILFFMLETWLWVIATLTLLVIAASFAFIKFNGRSFPILLASMFKYVWFPKFYLWQQEELTQKTPTLHAPTAQPRSPLKNLLFKLKTQKSAIPNREAEVSRPQSVQQPR